MGRRKQQMIPVQVIAKREYRLIKWALKKLAKAAFRYRYPLRPLWIALTLQFFIPAFKAASLAAGLNPVAFGWLCMIIAAVVIWAVVLDKIFAMRPDESFYACSVIVSIMLWCFLALPFGSFRPAIAAMLWIGGTLLSLPWWWHRRIRKQDTPTEPQADFAQKWAATVAHEKGALPGSSLENIDTTSDGRQTVADIILEPDNDQTASRAVTSIESVAARLRIGIQDIAIEPHPTGSANLARLTLFHGGNPLMSVQPWKPQGIDAEGRAHLGVFADFEPMYWQYWDKSEGVKHGLISGGTGGGKSRAADTLLCTERLSGGLVISWVIDGQNGQSLPEWPGNVDRFAFGPEEGLTTLSDTCDLMLDRSRRLTKQVWIDSKGRERTGVRSFTPTLEMPLLALTMDEGQIILNDRRSEKFVTLLAQMGRKCGIAIKLITQHPDLSQIKNETLRSQLRMGNLIAFRAATTQGVIATGGLLPDPSKLPRKWPDGSTTAGVCYAMPRGVMARTFYVDEDKTADIALDGEPWKLQETITTQAATLPAVGPAPAAGTPIVPSAPVAQVSKKEQVFAYVMNASQPVRRGDIITETGISISTVRDALASLLAEDRLSKNEDGLYVVATKKEAIA